MAHPLSNEALDQLFRAARTHSAWLDRPVSDDLLHQIYELMKWGPTSANLCPARILFLRTREAKERLRPALMPGNVEKTMAAPVTAIVAYDERFYELAPRLFPHGPGMRDLFINSGLPPFISFSIRYSELPAVLNDTGGASKEAP